MHSGSFVANANFVSDSLGSGSLRKTDPSGQAYELVWQDVWAGDFVLLTCTRVDEILAPIESQVRVRSFAGAHVAHSPPPPDSISRALFAAHPLLTLDFCQASLCMNVM